MLIVATNTDLQSFSKNMPDSISTSRGDSRASGNSVKFLLEEPITQKSTMDIDKVSVVANVMNVRNHVLNLYSEDIEKSMESAVKVTPIASVKNVDNHVLISHLKGTEKSMTDGIKTSAVADRKSGIKRSLDQPNRFGR